MANVRNGNTVYVDATGDLTTSGTRVYFIVLTPTSGSASIVLQDAGANVNKFRADQTASNGTQVYDFSARPLYFPGGVAVSTLTNCTATIVAEVQGG
jgi:uncharacterized protein YfaS (alpha-2-macroglobulin family)